MSSPARILAAIDASQLSEKSDNATTLLVVAEKMLDVSAIIVAVFVAYSLCNRLAPEQAVFYAPSTLFLCATSYGLLFVYLLERHDGYGPWVSLLAIRETERILRVTLQAFAIALVGAYLLAATIPTVALLAVLLLAPLFVILEKWESHRLLLRLRRRGLKRRAVIVGTGNEARHIYTALVRSPKFGVEPVAFVNETAACAPGSIAEFGYHHEHSAPVLSGPLRPELLRELRASVLVIADPSLDSQSIHRTAIKATEAGASTIIAPGNFLEPGYWLEYAELDGVTVAKVSRAKSRTLYRCGKRLLDVMGAGLAIALFAPVGVLVGIAVAMSSPGPIFFRQERVGRRGRLFTMFKFRSMYVDAPAYGHKPLAGHDRRITAVGRFLRRTSLDELPQLVNVMLGNMSLVGPRPEMPFIVEQYTPLQQQRLAVKPGITGLWQISGDRASLIHENITYDLYYLVNNPAFLWNIALQATGRKKFMLNTAVFGSEVNAD
jgi:exopolysaccharide biosynthesis polyprenyl glycosylphosphotransferase